jgi:hypothetical protein
MSFKFGPSKVKHKQLNSQKVTVDVNCNNLPSPLTFVINFDLSSQDPKHLLLLQRKPLNVITLGQGESDNINQMIIISNTQIQST